MSKQILKEKIDFFIDNKDSMGRNEREEYIEDLMENYGQFVPYSKYMLLKECLIEMINKRIIKRQSKT